VLHKEQQGVYPMATQKELVAVEKAHCSWMERLRTVGWACEETVREKE